MCVRVMHIVCVRVQCACCTVYTLYNAIQCECMYKCTYMCIECMVVYFSYAQILYYDDLLEYKEGHDRYNTESGMLKQCEFIINNNNNNNNNYDYYYIIYML